MTQSPLILVIDDSPTIRKMVECHLSQSGYRVAMAPDAEQGLEMAASIHPDLILLDHQLPGTTGDEVCKRLLESEATAHVPVLISSAMRNRAFAKYSEFPNVIDQIPKPFTPELLKSGVANGLATGALVEQAQRTGCAMPEAVNEEADAALSGRTEVFPFRAVLDFLTNAQAEGRLTLEQGKDRLRFALSAGRVQAVYSPTVAPARVVEFLPADLADLAPLLALTLGEHQDASMSGLVKLLERSLSDPRRLRSLLRAQSAVLTHWALTGGPGGFSFEGRAPLPPMFQAFPLQASLPALAVEGVRRCVPAVELEQLGAGRSSPGTAPAAGTSTVPDSPPPRSARTRSSTAASRSRPWPRRSGCRRPTPRPWPTASRSPVRSSAGFPKSIRRSCCSKTTPKRPGSPCACWGPRGRRFSFATCATASPPSSCSSGTRSPSSSSRSRPPSRRPSAGRPVSTPRPRPGSSGSSRSRKRASSSVSTGSVSMASSIGP